MSGEKILLVEDEPDIRDLLLFNLQREGYAVTASGNVTDALALMRDTACDLLLTDNLLPDGCGVDLIRQLQQAPQTRHVPTVLMTGGVRPVGSDATLATALLGKPFALAELRALLRDLLDAPPPVRHRQ